MEQSHISFTSDCSSRVTSPILYLPVSDLSTSHTSQIKSYYGTLSGSHGRTFRIRHEKSHEAPPGRDIMMTSYPAGNKTSIYQKPCIPDKKVTMEHYEEVYDTMKLFRL